MADSGIWTGAADAAWTNSANWSAAPYPSVADEATFSGAGGGNTIIDLSGLSGLKTLTFDTAGVAPYVIGAGGVAGQTLVLEDGGQIRLTATVANDQRADAAVQLGSDTTYASYTFRNDSASQTLTLAGAVAGAPTGGTAGGKTVIIQGTGDVILSGSISDGGASSVKLASSCEGTLTLSGANSYSGDTELYGGTLRLAHPNALNGVGRVLIRSPESDGAFLEVAHDGTNETPFRVAMGIYNGGTSGGTLVSGTGAGGVGINHAIAELGLSGVDMHVTRSDAVLSGEPSITVQSLILNGSGSYTAVLDPTTADLILGEVSIPAGNYRKTLELGGTSSGNRVDGVISNGISRISVTKSNVSTWTLTGANVYTGATTVTGGTLALAGADGTIKTSSDLTLSNGGTLLMDNTSVANGDRLGDAAPVTLEGGTLVYSHAADTADYSESAGSLTVSVGKGTVMTSQAGVGHSSVLSFDSLVNNGGLVDFVGEGLGTDSRNRILFNTPPTLSNGVIGLWATVNGTNLATYGENGITAYAGYMDISAKGPSTIPDDSGVSVRINSEGTFGGIGLAGTSTNKVFCLLQNTAWPATVSMGGKTLLTSGLFISLGMASLAIGSSEGEGMIAPLAEGSTLIVANNASERLIVNAGIGDNGAASSVSKTGNGEVVVNGATTYTGPTVINAGTLTLGGQMTPRTFTSVISGAGALGKSGTNLLHLMAANTFIGPTVISEGVVRANTSQTFGSTSEGDVFVADGATLDIGCTPDVGGTGSQDSINFGSQLFTVSGTGADGNGAIVNNSAVRQNNAFGCIALAADSAIGGTADWRIQNNTPSLTLNGHRLTKVGTNMVELYSVNVYPGAGHMDVAGGKLRMLYSANLHGSETNTLTVQNGATLELYKLSPALAPLWTLICKEGSVVRIGSETTADDNAWAGPVSLDGEVQLTAAGAYHQTFSGDISGPGSILKYTSSTVSFSGTNNTYVGATTVSNGVLVAYSPGSLPGYGSAGKVTVMGGGRLNVRTGDGTSGWSGAQIDVLHDAATFTANTAILGIDTTPADLILGYDITKALALAKCGVGALTLSGTNSFTGTLSLEEGKLELAGVNSLAGTVNAYKGELLLTGTLNQGSAAGNVIGESGDAILRLAAGSSMTGTGKFNVGRDIGNSGAFYLDDGAFVRNTSTSDSDYFCFGFNGGYGYLKVGGGTLSATRVQLGTTVGTTLGVGMIRMTGGDVLCANTFHISRNTNSVGVVTLDGGTLNHSNASTFIQMGYRGGRGELNLTGGTLINDGQTIQVRYSSGNSTGIVNLCAGQLSLNGFINNSGGTAWLNFRGGTLKATANATLVPSNMSGVYSYGPLGPFAGGAVIDTAGKTVSVTKPIEAPTGNGVTAINLSYPGSGLIGEPYVSITGGGGFGAAAVANMEDDGTGKGTYKVASVTITSPGLGYTSDPTVSFIRGGNGAVAPTATVTCAANTSGGLTKLGAGTLTLSAANSYTGATTVAGGTLALGHAAALPSGTMVVLAGGTLNLGGYTVTNAVSGTGAVTNGVMDAILSPAGAGAVGTAAVTLSGATLAGTYLADVTSAGACDFAVVNGTLDLSKLKLKLVDPDQLDRHHCYTLLSCTGPLSGTLSLNSPLDSRWHVTYVSDGRVMLTFVDGTLFKLK